MNPKAQAQSEGLYAGAPTAAPTTGPAQDTETQVCGCAIIKSVPQP